MNEIHEKMVVLKETESKGNRYYQLCTSQKSIKCKEYESMRENYYKYKKKLTYCK